MSFFKRFFKKNTDDKKNDQEINHQQPLDEKDAMPLQAEDVEETEKLEAEQGAEQEAKEVARLEAEQEAKEVARLEAEQEAKEVARLEAEQVAEAARLEAEQEAKEAARLEAEQVAEAARLKAEQEAKEVARLEAERVAEAARLKAEQEAKEVARLEAEQEAKEVARLEAERVAEAARLKAEQEAKEVARLEADQEAEAARLEAEQEAEEVARLEAEQAGEQAQPKKKGFFSKLVEGLTKTRDNILGSVDDVLKSFKKIDEDLYEELEEALIVADFGVDTSLRIMEQLKKNVKEKKLTEPTQLKHEIQEIITNMLTSMAVEPIIEEGKPNVVLVIGVNGVGKTTTIGKLANQLQADHKKVVLAAADTFRAAAIEQLQIWADRANVDLIKHTEGADPAAVVYDAIQAAKARKTDVLICDTAGRLQNKVNLMKELGKISKVIEREYPEAHREVLIVLDATTGQNALQQVKVFKEAADVDGIILTKLDGTAKGGAVVGICDGMNVPVKYIGVGEKIEDLQPFDPEAFAKALFVEN